MTKLQERSICPKDVLKKKQWSKYVSKGIALSLMHYNPKSKLFKSYKNTTFCTEVLLTNEVGKVHATYCKNRWCLVCNRIKTAYLINSYLPELEKLVHPVFVTLTLPTVTADELFLRIVEMEQAWRNIYYLTKKAKFKKTLFSFRGIRKAECTIRPNHLYHYHFHVILEGWAVGEWLVGQWLKKFPQANALAQDIRLADDFSLKELFKYAFKAEVKSDSQTNAQRYDLVFNALKKKQTLLPFGIRKVEEDFREDDLKNAITLEGKANRIFKWIDEDWFDTRSGDALVGLAIPDKVKTMSSYPR